MVGVYLITGPPGAGKSTIARKLAETSKKGALIEVDDIRHMILGGYEKPWLKNTESEQQKKLAIKNACDLANNFLTLGADVFIDDVITEKATFEQYCKQLRTEPNMYLLLPSKEIVIQRDSQRTEAQVMGQRAIDLYEKFLSAREKLDWRIIDNSSMTIEETVKLIKAEYSITSS